jgi:hypothetical protein
VAKLRGEAKKAYHQSKLDRLVTGKSTDPLDCFVQHQKDKTTILRFELEDSLKDAVMSLEAIANKKNVARRKRPAVMTMKEKVALIIRTEDKLNRAFKDIGKFILFPNNHNVWNKSSLNGTQGIVKIKDGLYGIGCTFLDFIHLKKDFSLEISKNGLRIYCNYSETNVQISQTFTFFPVDLRNAQPCSQERYSRIRRFRKEMWAYLRGGDIPNGELL